MYGQTVRELAALIGKIKLAKFIELSEDGYRRFIQETESSPLFERLIDFGGDLLKSQVVGGRSGVKSRRQGADCRYRQLEIWDMQAQTLRIITYKTFPGTAVIDSLSSNVVASIILLDGELERKLTRKSSSACDSTELVEVQNSRLPLPKMGQMVLVDGLKIWNSSKKSSFIIGFALPSLTGEYIIDKKKLRRLKREGQFTEAEKAQVDVLCGKLRLIDTRKRIIYQIIQGVIEHQYNYLESGNLKELKPLNQVQLGKMIGVDHSLISRATNGKFIKIPSGEEVCFKTLFPGNKRAIKYFVKGLLDREKSEVESGEIIHPYSDEEIKRKLEKDWGVTVSRRSIAKYRKELGISSSYKRR